MDRRQMVAQRAREYFGERLEDVVHMIRQDRQDMRGWEEPAHLRAVLRGGVRERGVRYREAAETALAAVEIGRAAGEPDRGQQREAIGQILEAGSNGLEKVLRNQVHDIQSEELLGLESVLLLTVGPPSSSIRISSAASRRSGTSWKISREEIEMAQAASAASSFTGIRIRLGRHRFPRQRADAHDDPPHRRTLRREPLRQLAVPPPASPPGWTTALSKPPAGYRVRNIIGVHDNYDLALLEVEPPQNSPGAPMPLAVAAQWPTRIEGRQVYLVGYPVRDARRNEPETITRIFRDVYNVKRVQPGVLRGTMQFRDIQLLQHDCAPLGQSCGGAIFDLETQQVLGMQLYSRYLECGTAIRCGCSARTHCSAARA